MARKVLLNKKNGTVEFGTIKTSKKIFTHVTSGAEIPADDIESVNVIIDDKIKAVPIDQFWKYNSYVNVLGDD